jgi:acetyl esterase/lipase
VVYGKGGGEDLKLDLYAPSGSPGPFPAMVLIHGGAWCAGAKEGYRSQARTFAEHGYVAVTVGYRLAPAHRFPAQVEDVKCAVRWLRANAHRYAVDPERIGAMGESAGGHLALLLGLTGPEDGFEGRGGWEGQSSKVRVVVNCAGPTDLSRPGWLELTDKVIADLLGAGRDANPAAYRAASPVSYVRPGSPPVLTIHGVKDLIVPYEQATVLDAALRAAGGTSRLEPVPDKGHIYDWGPPEWRHFEAVVFEFTDGYLKQRKPPAVTASQPAP